MTCYAAYFVDDFSAVGWVAFVVGDVDDDILDGCGAYLFDDFSAFDGAWVERWDIGSVFL